jgi:LytR cell envelope-related transcriptional attenuator
VASPEHAFRLDTGAFRAARRARRARRAAYWLLLALLSVLVASLIGLAVMALGSAGGAPEPRAVQHAAAAARTRVAAAAPTAPAPQAPLPVVPHTGAPAPATTTVAVWNGTRVTGLAGHTADRLRALGYPVGAIGDAPRHRFAGSFVLYGRGEGAAAWALARRLGMNPRLAVRPFDGPRKALGVASLVVVLGGR